MADEVWVAIITVVGVVVSATAAGLSAVAIAKINSTKTDVGAVKIDVGHAKDEAAAANTAAVAARDYSKPMGNGYADESRAAWRRMEAQLTDLAARQTRTDGWLIQYLSDRAQENLGQTRRRADTDPSPHPDDPEV